MRGHKSRTGHWWWRDGAYGPSCRAVGGEVDAARRKAKSHGAGRIYGLIRMERAGRPAAGLVFYSEAMWNTTEEPAANGTDCHHHGNGDNCTDSGDWNGHFTTCPEKLTYYCIHGECRYIKEMDEPSCRCEPGYIGSRCEFLELDWRKDERRQTIIICVCVGLLLLILFVTFICCFSHRRGTLCKPKQRRRDEPRNGTEKPHMDVTLALIHESTEQPRPANSV